MKKNKKIIERTSAALKSENDMAMDKLEGLWASKEAELEHCRLKTRYEADKAHQDEIQRLHDQVYDLEEQLGRQQNENIANQEVIE